MRSLSLKYRPAKFGDIIGQEVVAMTLARAVAAGKIHPAYLFHGSRGSGKTSMARIFAKALNCPNRINSTAGLPEPCGGCVSCKDIADARSLDVLEIDAASHTGVDNVREVIIDTMNLVPARDPYRVFIIDEVHMLSTSAFNAMLKTLEEPQDHVVFILATTELTKVPATVVSRTQSFTFRALPANAIVKRLEDIASQETIVVEPLALREVAHLAAGSMRDAISILEQLASLAGPGETITRQSMTELLGLVEEQVLDGLTQALVFNLDVTSAKDLIHEALYSSGYTPNRLISALYEWCSQKMVAALEAQETELYAHRLYQFTNHLAAMLGTLRFSTDPLIFCEVELMGYLLGQMQAAHKPIRLERGVSAEKEASLEVAIEPQPQNFPIPSHSRESLSSLRDSVGPRPQDGGGNPDLDARLRGHDEKRDDSGIPAVLGEVLPQSSALPKNPENWQAKFSDFLASAQKETWGFYFDGSAFDLKKDNPPAFLVKFSNAFNLKGVQNHQEKIRAFWRKFFGDTMFESLVTDAPPKLTQSAPAPKKEIIPEDVQKMADIFGGTVKKAR